MLTGLYCNPSKIAPIVWSMHVLLFVFTDDTVVYLGIYWYCPIWCIYVQISCWNKIIHTDHLDFILIYNKNKYTGLQLNAILSIPTTPKKYTNKNKQANKHSSDMAPMQRSAAPRERLKAPPSFDSTHPAVRLIYLSIGFYWPSQTASCDLLNDLNRVFLFSICLLAWWRESGTKEWKSGEEEEGRNERIPPLLLLCRLFSLLLFSGSAHPCDFSKAHFQPRFWFKSRSAVGCHKKRENQ